MADFSISSTVTPASGSGSAPPSRPVDNARENFDDHLKRADEPNGPQSTKRPAGRDATQPDNSATEKSSDSDAAAAPADASQDDQSNVGSSDSKPPASAKQGETDGKPHDDHPKTDVPAVAAVTIASVEQAVATPIDEVTISSDTCTDSPPPSPPVGKSVTETTNAALQQAVTAQTIQTSDATAKATVTSAATEDASTQDTTEAATSVGPLPSFAPASLKTLEEAVSTNRRGVVRATAQAIAQVATTPVPAAQAQAAQAAAGASAAQPIVTIVSAQMAQAETTSDNSHGKEKSTDSSSNETPASAATPIQAALTAIATPPSQPLDLGSDSNRNTKRGDADRDPVAPTDAAPKSPPAAAADAPATNNRFQISLGSRSEFRSDGTSEVDRVRFVQRVARAFQAADEQGGQVRLRLNPPELGAMKLEITMKGGVMTAKVETETPAARSLLLDNLPALRDRLAEHNVKVEKFDVDVMDRQPGGMPDTPDGSDRGARSPRPFAGGQGLDEPAETAAIGGRIFVDSGRLNVVI